MRIRWGAASVATAGRVPSASAQQTTATVQSDFVTIFGSMRAVTDGPFCRTGPNDSSLDRSAVPRNRKPDDLRCSPHDEMSTRRPESGSPKAQEEKGRQDRSGRHGLVAKLLSARRFARHGRASKECRLWPQVVMSEGIFECRVRLAAPGCTCRSGLFPKRERARL